MIERYSSSNIMLVIAMQDPTDPEKKPRRRLIPLTRWPDFHPWPSLGGLRHLVFHAEKNGFDAAVRRIGRRVLVDETAFFEWVDRQNKAGHSAEEGA